jgi:hypothetical protein
VNEKGGNLNRSSANIDRTHLFDSTNGCIVIPKHKVDKSSLEKNIDTLGSLLTRFELVCRTADLLS